MLVKIDPRTTRNLVAACRAAMRAGTDRCGIRLTDGSTHGFRITEILDDAIMGAREAAPHKACLVQVSAIAMIEFG